jgi:hypothetical protein
MPLNRVRLFSLLALSVIACSSSSGTPHPDGGGGAGGGAGGSGGTAPWTCAEIRAHALGSDCADDTCVAAFKAMGSADAQAAFQALYDCDKNVGGCTAPNMINCICSAECVADPPCADRLNTCLQGAVNDPAICDSQCH